MTIPYLHLVVDNVRQTIQSGRERVRQMHWWHTWGRWSAPFECVTQYVSEHTGCDRGTKILLVQERHCLHCNIVQQRTIRALQKRV